MIEQKFSLEKIRLITKLIVNAAKIFQPNRTKVAIAQRTRSKFGYAMKGGKIIQQFNYESFATITDGGLEIVIRRIYTNKKWEKPEPYQKNNSCCFELSLRNLRYEPGKKTIINISTQEKGFNYALIERLFWKVVQSFPWGKQASPLPSISEAISLI